MKTGYVHSLWVDLDDTLIVTNAFYLKKRQEALALLEQEFPRQDLNDFDSTLNAIERKNVKGYGFIKDRFPKSMGDLYEHYCLKFQGGLVSENTLKQFQAVGWSVYEESHPIKESVVEVLDELRARGYRLCCITKGDPEVQQIKLDKTDLARHFDVIEIVPDKTREVYEQLIVKYGLVPHQTYMIGDSIKSDINPSVEAGLNAVYIPTQDAWANEVEDLRVEHIKLDHIGDLLDLFPGIDVRHDLLAAARDERVAMVPSHELRRLMPNCPGELYLFAEHLPDGSMREHQAVFEREILRLEIPGLDPKEVPVPKYQWAVQTIGWPAQGVPDVLRHMMPYNLCRSCPRYLACAIEGIAEGTKIDSLELK